MHTFKNPIIPGFYPDPSICKVGEDYYLVNSTFSYFPGVPIFHSKDLVNWKQIGNVLDRPSQLELIGRGHSEGIYAPTIRYHEGIFYMITTNVGGIGNFYVTATEPQGPWSEPIILDAEGIDPSLFFDEDGKVYYVGTRHKPEGVFRYYGDSEVWLQELDLAKGCLIGEQYVLWEGALVDSAWSEAPHIYKKNDYYYLMIAEGGTGLQHAITIARSKEIKGLYENNACNPILTHRHLGRDYPIVNVGHGDLVEAVDGSWWMVLLASRPYGGHYSNLGRETFLVPVTWEEGWPVVNVGKGIVEEVCTAPQLKEHWYVPESVCDQFEGNKLSDKWLFLRTPSDKLYSLSERKGYLRLYTKPEHIKDLVNPSFVGQRQQHMSYEVSTVLEFEGHTKDEMAGVVLIQSNDYLLSYEKTMDSIRLIKREKGQETELICIPFLSKRLYMRIIAREQALTFLYGECEDDNKVLISNVDSRFLSTECAGGFVGTCIGLYTSSNGKETCNYADFDWFLYRGL